MPVLTIDVSEEIAACIAALPPAGQTELTRRVQNVVAASLSQNEFSDEDKKDAEGAAWWNSLSPEEQAAEHQAVLRSFADGDAGRTKPADEVYARVRAKFVGNAAS